MEVEGSWCILCAGMDGEAEEEGDTTGENAVAVGTAASAAAAEQRTAAVVFMVMHVCAEHNITRRACARRCSGYELNKWVLSRIAKQLAFFDAAKKHDRCAAVRVTTTRSIVDDGERMVRNADASGEEEGMSNVAM